MAFFVHVPYTFQPPRMQFRCTATSYYVFMSSYIVYELLYCFMGTPSPTTHLGLRVRLRRGATELRTGHAADVHGGQGPFSDAENGGHGAVDPGGRYERGYLGQLVRNNIYICIL